MQVNQYVLYELETPSIFIISACKGHRYPRLQRLIHGVLQPPILNPQTPPSPLHPQLYPPSLPATSGRAKIVAPFIGSILSCTTPSFVCAIPVKQYLFYRITFSNSLPLFPSLPLQPLDKLGALLQSIDGCSDWRFERRPASTAPMETCFGALQLELYLRSLLFESIRD